MKIFIALTTMAVSFSSTAFAADSLYCHFTEPFITIEWNGTTKEISKTSPEDYDQKTGQIIPKILGKGKIVMLNNDNPETVLELRDENNAVIVSMILNMAGGDGMSDNTYPFSGYYGDLEGGCYTDNALPWNSPSITEGLETELDK